MTKIDTSKPVLVTGATGYVAGWLVKKLLEEGMTVHAAVRDPGNKEKTKHLDEIAAGTQGKIKYFKSDLLEAGSYADAMKACELVYHTASPFTSDSKNPQKDLIDPAVKGTENILEQANQTKTVKRVVLTSSCAAIYTDCSDVEKTPDGVFTEAIWNTTASLDYQPYSLSKTLAEKMAWGISKQQSQWDLVVINPCMVFGPPLNPDTVTSESISLLKQFGDGTVKFGVPNIGIGIVDVRDVAIAHFRAGYIPEAEGRHITCGHRSSFQEAASILKSSYGNDYPISDRALPKGLLLLFGPIINKSLNRRFIRNNVNKEWKGDNSKSKKALGITYRPLKETMDDSFRVLIDHQVFGKE